MADLVLAGVDYNVVAFNNRTKIYNATAATQPGYGISSSLERAFSPAIGKRPARSLVKFYVSTDNGTDIRSFITYHTVITLGMGMNATTFGDAVNNTTNGLFKQQLELASLGTDYAYLDEIMNGAI